MVADVVVGIGRERVGCPRIRDSSAYLHHARVPKSDLVRVLSFTIFDAKYVNIGADHAKRIG